MIDSTRPVKSTRDFSNLSYEEKLKRIQRLKEQADKKESKIRKQHLKDKKREAAQRAKSDLAKRKEELKRIELEAKEQKRIQKEEAKHKVVASKPSNFKPIRRKNLKVSRAKNALLIFALIGITGFSFYKSGLFEDIYSDIQNRISIERAKAAEAEENDAIVIPEEETEITVDDLVDEEEVIERHETISTELYDSGYEFDEDITPSYLKTLNPLESDNLAWIDIPGTHINYALAHPTTSNIDEIDGLRENIDKSDLNEIDFMNQYFLHRDLNGNKSSKGTLFLDINNNGLNNHSDELSDMNVVYGHTMKDSTMFKDLTNWKYDKTGNYNSKHPFGIIYTDDGFGYKVTFITSRVIDGNNWEQLHLQNFNSYEEKSEYISNIICDAQNHGWFTLDDYEVQPDDKFICLTACSYDNMYGGNNDRYQLIGVLEKIKIRENDLTNNYDGYYVEESSTLNR